MNLLLDRCSKRSTLVKELYEDWRLDHEEATFAADVEALCGECLDLCRLCKQAWHDLWNELFDRGVGDTERVGREFQAIIERSVEVVRGIGQWIAEAEKRGFHIAGAAQHVRGLKEIEKVQREVAEKWPFADFEMIAASRAAALSGECQTIEELLDAVPGSCAQTDQ